MFDFWDRVLSIEFLPGLNLSIVIIGFFTILAVIRFLFRPILGGKIDALGVSKNKASNSKKGSK